MGQSLAAVYVHLIFSTSGRIAFLGEHIQPRLWQYMGGICKTLNCVPVQIGGMSDHVHVLCLLSYRKNLPPLQGGLLVVCHSPGQCGLSDRPHPGCILAPLRGFCPFRALKQYQLYCKSFSSATFCLFRI